MTRPWFTDPARQALLVTEADSWRGTPHRPGRSEVKGPRGGVDCCRLVACVLEAVGAIRPIDRSLIPPLPMDYAATHTEAVIEPFVRDHIMPHQPIAEFTDSAAIMPGDVLIFQLRKRNPAFHFGLCVDERRVLHCPLGAHAGYIPRDHKSLPDLFARGYRILEVDA